MRQHFRWRHRIGHHLSRWQRATAYARGTLTADQAQDIILECRDPAGWYPLTMLCAEDVLAHALETYQDHPSLAEHIAEGCAHVARKSGDDPDQLHAAREWAIEKALDYACANGITFTEINSEETN